MWMEEHTGKKVNIERTEEALDTGAQRIAVACPFCYVMMDDGVKEKGRDEDVKVQDIAELLIEAHRERARARPHRSPRTSSPGSSRDSGRDCPGAPSFGTLVSQERSQLAGALPLGAPHNLATPTVPPIAARRALKRLLTPLPAVVRTGPTNRATASR